MCQRSFSRHLLCLIWTQKCNKNNFFSLQILAFTMAPAPTRMVLTSVAVPPIKQGRIVNWRKQHVMAIPAMELTFVLCLNDHLVDFNA